MGEGSCFTVTIPCAIGEEFIGDEAVLPSSGRIKVSNTGRSSCRNCKAKFWWLRITWKISLLISHVLQQLNVQFDMANNGAQALTFAVQHQYDLFLFDLQMPLVGGKRSCRNTHSPGNQNTDYRLYRQRHDPPAGRI